MSGFCGQCGTPRAEGSKFCMTCGARLGEIRMCPTCNQEWPQGENVQPPPVTVSASIAEQVVSEPVRGMYATAEGTVYFDGQLAWVAADRGGFYMPDMSQPIQNFNIRAVGVTLISADTRPVSDRPTGPSLGNDYVPGRDCGNCGFELNGNTGPCSTCGSANTGPLFDPSAMN